MIRYLFLMRHGDALPTSPGGDRTRELSEKGHGDINEIAQVLASTGFQPTLLIHSPFIRTTQTAKIIADAIGCHDRTTVSPCLASGEALEPMIHELEAFGNEEILFVVAHMPDVGELGAEFGLMSLGQQYSFVPGALACIQFEGPIQRGKGKVTFLSRPSDTKQLSEKLQVILS